MTLMARRRRRGGGGGGGGGGRRRRRRRKRFILIAAISTVTRKRGPIRSLSSRFTAIKGHGMMHKVRELP
jgi:hypothetical protein